MRAHRGGHLCAQLAQVGRQLAHDVPPANVRRGVRLAPTNFTRKLALQRLAVVVLRIRSTTEITIPSLVCTRKRDESFTDGISSSRRLEQVRRRRQRAEHGGGASRRARSVGEEGGGGGYSLGFCESCCFDNVTLGIQLAVGPQQLRLRNHNFGLTHRIMVKRLETSPHDPLGITDSACKNPSVMVSVHYGPFNTYIPIRSTTIGKSRVARDPITMHTSWRSNSDIACVTRRAMNPRQRSIDSYMHRDLTQSRHLMTPTKSVNGQSEAPTRRVSMTFRVMRANLYNQDLGLINSTNGNHLESPNEGSSIDHQERVARPLGRAKGVGHMWSGGRVHGVKSCACRLLGAFVCVGSAMVRAVAWTMVGAGPGEGSAEVAPAKGGRRWRAKGRKAAEHAGPLGSLGLNGAGEHDDDFILTDGEDL
ncbi:hypothetical protein F511_21287 [Dorcoceras hygrometricum]|uniref:Uncharacterized protein n=1 Tax=Dorcoceras hygrometricum TaxID=472368 RepID=A0A2Z7AUM4_9LAMI|nr:hypothetical protein F511_21287 [Dorcoceras hygrometricum]